MKNIICSLAFLTLCQPGSGQTPDSKPAAPTSTESVLVIYTKGSSESMGSGVVVSGVTSEDFHGMKCLVGQGVTEYLKNSKVRVPLDSIVMMLEYKNKEEWAKSVKGYATER